MLLRYVESTVSLVTTIRFIYYVVESFEGLYLMCVASTPVEVNDSVPISVPLFLS
jgi:hypothetical protein